MGKEFDRFDHQQILKRQVGPRKLKKAQQIREKTWRYVLENPFFDPTSSQGRLLNLSDAEKAGRFEGENYLWPKRIYNKEVAWSTAIVDGIKVELKSIQELSDEEKEVALKKTDGKIRDFLTVLEAEDKEKPYHTYQFIFELGVLAADNNLTERAEHAMNMLPEKSYETGVIAAKIGDEKTARGVVFNMLRWRNIRKEKAEKVAHIGLLLEDQELIVNVIKRLEHQRNFFAAADIAVEFDELEIAQDLVKKMLGAHQYLPAGKISSMMNQLETVHQAIVGLILDEKFDSALKLVNLTQKKEDARLLWESLSKKPHDPKTEKLKEAALKIYFGNEAAA